MNVHKGSQRRAYLHYVLAGVGLYLFFLIATAPASLMEWLLPRLSNGRLVFEQSDGGFWHGRAQQVLLKKNDGNLMPLGSADWKILFLPMFKLEFAAKIELENGQTVSQGIIAKGIDKFQMRQMSATLPIEVLAEFIPSLQTWKPKGDLALKINDFSIRQKKVVGEADIEWRNASVSLSRVNPLGNYLLNIHGEKNVSKIRLSTLSGVLRLAGQGEWLSEKGVNFRGTAQAESSRKAELQDLLKLIGREHGNGVYQIEIAHLQKTK